MTKLCPKCMGTGLGDVGTHIPTGLPPDPASRCFMCNGKGWLPDDSDAKWERD